MCRSGEGRSEIAVGYTLACSRTLGVLCKLEASLSALYALDLDSISQGEEQTGR